MGNRDEDVISSLAGRLARLDRKLNDEDRQEIADASNSTLKQLINGLLDAIDADKRVEKARELFETENPTLEQLEQSVQTLAKKACTPFQDKTLRNLLVYMRKRGEMIIDTISQDEVISTGYDEQAKKRARSVVDSFRKFIEQNRDELTALQLIYSRPYGARHATYDEIKKLAKAIGEPPYNLTQEAVWRAYEQLDKSRVRGAGTQKLLTNIISLVRFAVGENGILEPFSDVVERRFSEWLARQERDFTSEQTEWLKMIKDQIATSYSIEMDDFQLSPFHEKGGEVKVYQIFGNDLESILQELNEVLAA